MVGLLLMDFVARPGWFLAPARDIAKVFTDPACQETLKFGLSEQDIDGIYRDTTFRVDKEDAIWLTLQTKIICQK